MNSNENVVNYNVLDHIKIYNFGFSHFPKQVWTIQKLEFQILRNSNKILGQ